MPSSKHQASKNKGKKNPNRVMSKLGKSKPKSRTSSASTAGGWDEFIGMFRNDLDFQEVKEHIERNRKKQDRQLMP